jgi:hypothetical protein
MEFHSHLARYNRRIRQMKSLFAMLARLSRKASLSLACLFLGLSLAAPSLRASNLDTAARQLADRIASTTGPGSITLEVANRSSLDDKSAKEVRSAIQAELRIKGVHAVAADQSVGSVNVILSESLREFVWTAVIAIGADPPRTVLVSSPRPPAAPFAPAFPLTLKKTLLFSNEQPILDAALIDASGGMLAEGVATIPAGARLLVLEPARVVVYRQQSGHWDLETSLPINVSRVFPRDVRGRLFLRRDHLFDAYLPGAFCRSSSAAPLTMNCARSDDPWPLTSDEIGPNAVRAFYAPARNFFTGALSPGIGKISNAPSFYSAAPLARSNYTLWVLATVDGSIHEIDGVTDQAIRSARSGSDLAAIRSTCGAGTQLLVSESGDSDRDSLRAFEIPDRDPVAVTSPLEFDGTISALWPNAALASAVAIVKRADTGWYEANRITISCAH